MIVNTNKSCLTAKPEEISAMYKIFCENLEEKRRRNINRPVTNYCKNNNVIKFSLNQFK